MKPDCWISCSVLLSHWLNIWRRRLFNEGESSKSTKREQLSKCIHSSNSPTRMSCWCPSLPRLALNSTCRGQSNVPWQDLIKKQIVKLGFSCYRKKSRILAVTSLDTFFSLYFLLFLGNKYWWTQRELHPDCMQMIRTLIKHCIANLGCFSVF